MSDESNTTAPATAPAAKPVTAKKKVSATKTKKKEKKAPASDTRGGLTFSQLMKTRLSNGNLRTAHVDLLRGMDKFPGAASFEKISEKSKVNARTANPAIQFLCEEGLAKVQVVEGEGKQYKITAQGRSAVAKHDAAAAKAAK